MDPKKSAAGMIKALQTGRNGERVLVFSFQMVCWLLAVSAAVAFLWDARTSGGLSERFEDDKMLWMLAAAFKFELVAGLQEEAKGVLSLAWVILTGAFVLLFGKQAVNANDDTRRAANAYLRNDHSTFAWKKAKARLLFWPPYLLSSGVMFAVILYWLGGSAYTTSFLIAALEFLLSAIFSRITLLLLPENTEKEPKANAEDA